VHVVADGMAHLSLERATLGMFHDQELGFPIDAKALDGPSCVLAISRSTGRPQLNLASGAGQGSQTHTVGYTSTNETQSYKLPTAQVISVRNKQSVSAR
jgi:hypothetical protein